MASIMTKIAPAYREHASHARRSVARMERERSSEPVQAQTSTAYIVQIIPSSDIEREALAMENLLQAFSLDEPFSLELCGEHNQQRFLLRAASESALETLCKQMLAQYPQAQLSRVSPMADPLALADGEHAIIGDFTLRTSIWMPIKTFWGEELTQAGTDPVVGLLAAMEPVRAGERITSQVTLVSAPDSWTERYQRKAMEHPLDQKRQAAGGTSNDTILHELWMLVGTGLALIAGFQIHNWYVDHAWALLALTVLLALCGCTLLFWWRWRRKAPLYDVKLASEKLMRTAFYSQVRVMVIGDRRSTEKRLRLHLKRIELAYRQYDLAGGNGLILKQVRYVAKNTASARHLCRPEYSLPYHNAFSRLVHGGWSSDILNAREVSGMWHLVQGQAEVPLVERHATKKILASPELFQRVRRGAFAFPPVLAGFSQHRGYSVPIYLPEETLFSHKFLIAKSGYGKSTLMQLLLRGAMQPVRNPKGLQPGVVAIDPHGDLIGDLLRQVPESRIHDVVVVDLSDEAHPVGINLLDATMGFSNDQAVANAMASFSRVWKDSWGPRLAYVLKHVIKSLYTVNEQLVARGKKEQQYTLLDVNNMLQQPKYARKILAGLDKENIQHQKELSWWNDYYFKLPPSFQQEVISPVSNKMGIFSDNHTLERIVGQPLTTINVALAVQQGHTVLVNLASGRLEFDAAAIIGATILNLVHRTLQQQAHVPYPERRQVFIAVDEFQNIPGADYEALLSEDRKYGGSLMLATQSLIRLEQMKEGLETITFSNCAQLFVFATSAEDAEKLEKELHGKVSVPHILNQSRLNCYARLALADQPMQIFSMQLARPEGWERSPENEARAETILAWNRERHPAAVQVDHYLTEHHRRFMEMSGQTVQAPPPAGAKQEGKKPSPPANPPKPQGTPAGAGGQKPNVTPPVKGPAPQVAPHSPQSPGGNKQNAKQGTPASSPRPQDKPLEKDRQNTAAPVKAPPPPHQSDGTTAGDNHKQAAGAARLPIPRHQRGHEMPPQQVAPGGVAVPAMVSQKITRPLVNSESDVERTTTPGTTRPSPVAERDRSLGRADGAALPQQALQPGTRYTQENQQAWKKHHKRNHQHNKQEQAQATATGQPGSLQ